MRRYVHADVHSCMRGRHAASYCVAWRGPAWPGRAGPGLACPCLASPRLAWPCLALPYLAQPYVIIPIPPAGLLIHRTHARFTSCCEGHDKGNTITPQRQESSDTLDLFCLDAQRTKPNRLIPRGAESIDPPDAK